jgi:hypothetical protein
VATPKKLPPKARVEGGGRVTPKGGPAKAAPAGGAAKPPKAGETPATDKPRSNRKREKAEAVPDSSSRYTPPSARDLQLPSPTWVPVLMFTLFALGMLVIFLNYVELLPGSVSNWYLLVGLGLILAGIITATQYR